MRQCAELSHGVVAPWPVCVGGEWMVLRWRFFDGLGSGSIMGAVKKVPQDRGLNL
jgi:hypothetical protein